MHKVKNYLKSFPYYDYYFIFKMKYSTLSVNSYGRNLQVVEKEIVVFTWESLGNRREMRLISMFSLAKLSHLFKHSMSLPFFLFENESENNFLIESSFCPHFKSYLTFQIMDCAVKMKKSILTISIKMIFDFPLSYFTICFHFLV